MGKTPARQSARAKGKAPARDTGSGSVPRQGQQGEGRGRGQRQGPVRADTQASSGGDIPLVYRDMLAEVGHGDSADDDRPIKRRKVGEGRGVVERVKEGVHAEGEGGQASRPVQTIYIDDASDDDEEEEMEWEDVEFGAAPVAEPAPTVGYDSTVQGRGNEQQRETEGQGEAEDSLQLTLIRPSDKGKQRAATVARRKPVTEQERRWRLDIHKMHVLCLLSHVQRRNIWCNDDGVQDVLKGLLNKHTIICLNPKETLPQFTRSTTFADGLKQACDTFRRRFKITAPGMKRPYWLENPSELKDPTALLDTAEILLSKEDFLKQASALQGSRDLGAQLFCALLRAVGVDARLVCSLQVLPFTGVARGMTPSKPEREYIVISEDDGAKSTGDAGQSPAAASPASAQNTPPPSRIRRLGQPRFSASPAAANPKPKQAIGLPRGFSESPFPVFWVETFNEAMQKWVPVDPLVTNTIGKPTKFEPPAADRYNNMSYVVAFEDDASARDVTKRYTKFFNSKTRKQRVESTKNGEEWWARTMQFFEKPFLDDRDQVEIGELTSKTAAEMMPRNVQDFKDHPVYALERHLRRNEVIFPKREIGKVGLSKVSPNKKNPPLEPVYRRGDVHVVKSADGWYRQGREVKIGEQPLKRVAVSRPKGALEHRQELADYFEEEAQETPMYAIYQTELYKPPPIVDNHVTKNAYGNIDVYTPNMVPEGGFHLRHPEAARAARILDIDYADAVTGFQFRGRHGTAVTQGIVASVEYREALLAVLDGLEDERVREEEERRSAQALRMWNLLLIKLRVAERVRGYAVEGEEEEAEEDVGDDEGGTDEEEEEGGGGFIREAGQEDIPSPRGGLAGFESMVGGGGFIPEEDTANLGGGFLGGGFMPATAVPEESGPSTSISGLGSAARPRAHNTPRYSLIVTPKDSSQQSSRNQPAAESHPPQRSSPSATESLQTQQPQQRLPTYTQPTTTTTSAAMSMAISTSSGGEQSNSAEEYNALPDLVHEEGSDSEIDQSSMLSHDPEDEDADPEWLLSD
ncbi:hypothetical protein AJ79_08599 [Helicocarpus griseus UAMH5409]|uniref:Xeroderma pigmentosum group C-complementing protein n=1 Tax=Helicocarpus griseus UAMH5409 TaxID=1447875 RepID=A0A2B7WRM1_9EURO|nr:hypothetical protein AJ79_08599 [Helicocarpus griseus UAMH5409]